MLPKRGPKLKPKSKLKDRPDNKLTDRHKKSPNWLWNELKDLLKNASIDSKLKSKLNDKPTMKLSEELNSLLSLPLKELRKNKF